MSAKSTYRPGEPIWTDLSSPDPAASAAFYGALLGWTVTEAQPDFGGYASFLLDGQQVAGLMPLMAPGQPPTWTAYLCSHDADKTAGLVEQAGGGTVAPPMDVGDLGRMAVHTDPAGAVFGVWQPGAHAGAQRVREDGAPSWLELTAERPAAAAAFYADVFGLEPRVSQEYVELTLDGTSVAGVADPSQGTTGWLPYFGAADPGAAAERAVELGGTVVLPLTPFPGGSCAIVRDPHGAVFGLLHDDS